MENYNSKSFETGLLFEDFVEQTLFPKHKYLLLEKTHDYRQNSKRFVESSKKPDFKFRCKSTGQEFYVEAKFRSGFNNNDQISIFKEYQYKRFAELAYEAPILVVIGIGSEPNNPQLVSLIPFQKIHFLNLFRSVVFKHIVDKHKAYELNHVPEFTGSNLPNPNQPSTVSEDTEVQIETQNYGFYGVALVLILMILFYFTFLYKP